ncbi:MAG: xanthosine utilization system XapX-like protein [Planctomycetota bacterium]|jgi:xanthosine utilization system XapX-like protein
MTDANGKDKEFDELESLEPLEELQELEELEPLEKQAPETAPAGGAPNAVAAAAAGGAAGSRTAASSEDFGKRELEQTPIVLRKASMILFAGSLLPWLVALKIDPDIATPWAALYTAKAVALVAAWLFHQSNMATHNGPAIGLMKSLAKIHSIVPSALASIVGLVSIYLGFGHEGLDSFAAAAELATMLLAAATFSHIWGYEHGGKFNPIFPIMFLGPAMAGLLSVFGAAAAFKTNAGLAGAALIGCLAVGAGGCMAMNALYQSMKQAKVEGDEKKRLQREARKAARAAAGKGGGSGVKKGPGA